MACHRSRAIQQARRAARGARLVLTGAPRAQRGHVRVPGTGDVSGNRPYRPLSPGARRRGAERAGLSSMTRMDPADPKALLVQFFKRED